MTRPPLDEAVAYAALIAHVESNCFDCEDATNRTTFGALCPVGLALLKAWGEADRYAARLAETDATGFSLDDEYPAGLA